MSYSHTQRGWLVPLITIPVFALVIGLAASAGQGTRVALVVAPIAFLMWFGFGWLETSVDDRAVHVKFGIGLMQRSIPLAAIERAFVTEADGMSGLGAHMISKGWIYNISTGRVVELALVGGRRVQIGTDDLDGLHAAIESARASLPPTAEPAGTGESRWRMMVFIPIGVAVLIVVFVFLDASEPKIWFDGRTLHVASTTYSFDAQVGAIRSVTVVDRPPPMRTRSNGFAGFGKLRGHFVSDSMGRGMVFTDAGHPPYIVVHTANSFVVFNTPDSARTRALGEQLAAVVHR